MAYTETHTVNGVTLTLREVVTSGDFTEYVLAGPAGGVFFATDHQMEAAGWPIKADTPCGHPGHRFGCERVTLA